MPGVRHAIVDLIFGHHRNGAHTSVKQSGKNCSESRFGQSSASVRRS
jgi:hypothetical protein